MNGSTRKGQSVASGRRSTLSPPTCRTHTDAEEKRGFSGMSSCRGSLGEVEICSLILFLTKRENDWKHEPWKEEKKARKGKKNQFHAVILNHEIQLLISELLFVCRVEVSWGFLNKISFSLLNPWDLCIKIHFTLFCKIRICNFETWKMK